MIRLEFNAQEQTSDLLRPDGKNILSDELLDTAITLSLFTRRRAEPGDILPDPNSSNPEGWWGDHYEKIPAHRQGSRLWLLGRSKAIRSVRNLARVYALEALQWLVDDGIAERLVIATERQQDKRLALRVEVYKPGEVAARWVKTWAFHMDEL